MRAPVRGVIAGLHLLTQVLDYLPGIRERFRLF
jgi:hypothetical protein